MGAYGSPQIGYFANDNKKPKPKSNGPWFVLIIITLIVLGASTALNIKKATNNNNYTREMPLITKRDINEKTEISEKGKEHAPVTPTGLLSNKTAMYLKKDKAVFSKLLTAIETIETQTQAETLNIIDTQNTITSLKKELENLYAEDIDEAYYTYKKSTNETYDATITVIQNYLINGTLDYNNAIIINNAFAEESNKSYEMMKELFDENNITYHEEISEEGNKNLEYRYSATPY